MLVTLTPKKFAHEYNFVYADVRCNNTNEIQISGTLDYCIDACKDRGFEITNAQSVLEWLHKNVDFKPF